LNEREPDTDPAGETGSSLQPASATPSNPTNMLLIFTNDRQGERWIPPELKRGITGGQSSERDRGVVR
jgi:hypothetical protein